MNGSTHTPASSQEADPRTTLTPDAERDVRPQVDRPRAGLSGRAIAGLAGVVALALFGLLEARRENAMAPVVTRTSRDRPSSMAPPPLYLPPPPPAAAGPIPTPLPPPIITPVPAPVRQIPPEVARVIPSIPVNQVPQAQVPVVQPRNAGGAALVLDTSAPAATVDEAEKPVRGSGGERSGGLSTTRVRAAMFANRSTTVPQGTLIPAVLETAFDSTSPGFARALVQKDIHGFDGTRVLIPRGSRLIGEYGADTARGQKRAVILWSRLIRPDGVTIAIGSPAADPEGRGGVKADVNTHFLERFSGAILQSALDVGVALAARNSRSPVIVALPGSTTGVTGNVSNRGNEITPTLRVPAGRSVSVFVARDLDFTQAEARP